MDFDVALIGFGEAGDSFARSAAWRDRAAAYDLKTASPATSARKMEDYRAAGISDFPSAAEAAAAAPIVLSLVTADEAVAAARSTAPGLHKGTLYCDGNSVAPDTKRAAAQIIEAAGGRYVDMAILAPVHPASLSVPILLSGQAANEACSALRALGFDSVQVAGDSIGKASAIKMIRSVMVKGIEALTAECVLAASRAGVLDEVLSSLDASEKHPPWLERADYNLDRMLVHGSRRAAEMEEVAKTLMALGIKPEMTRGTIILQRAIGGLSKPAPGCRLADKIDIIERKGSEVA